VLVLSQLLLPLPLFLLLLLLLPLPQSASNCCYMTTPRTS
jgi:hypothetical protein